MKKFLVIIMCLCTAVAFARPPHLPVRRMAGITGGITIITGEVTACGSPPGSQAL